MPNHQFHSASTSQGQHYSYSKDNRHLRTGRDDTTGCMQPLNQHPHPDINPFSHSDEYATADGDADDA